MPVLLSQPATAVSYWDAEVQVSTSAEDVAHSAENTTVLFTVLWRRILRVNKQHMLLNEIKTSMENCIESGSCLFSFCQNPFSAPLFFCTESTCRAVGNSQPCLWSPTHVCRRGKKRKNSRKIELNYKKKTKICKRIAVFTELDLIFDTICIHLPE